MPISKHTILALSAVAMMSTAPAAYAGYYDAPSDQQAAAAAAQPKADTNDIIHVTGGIGEDEQASLEAVKGDYNVHITNSNKEGAFNDSTALSIFDKAGNELVTADAGPLFYVELPPGTYKITADHRGRTQSKTVKIVKAHAKASKDLHFIW